MDMARARDVLGNLISSCRKLGIEQENIPKWEAILAKLLPYPVTKDGVVPSDFGFKDLIHHHFKAEKFDADALVKQFKDWGARYVAMMACHHDNFDLYPTKVHDWNTTKVGPKRDLVGEFATAAKPATCGGWGLFTQATIFFCRRSGRQDGCEGGL